MAQYAATWEEGKWAILKTGHTYSLDVKVTQSHSSKGSEEDSR